MGALPYLRYYKHVGPTWSKFPFIMRKNNTFSSGSATHKEPSLPGLLDAPPEAVSLLSTRPVHPPLCARAQLAFYISLCHLYDIQRSIYDATPKEMETLWR